MCLGWVQDCVPDHGKEKATVEVHVRDGFPDLDGLHSPSLPEPSVRLLDCGTIPVDAVVCPLKINCNAVLGVSSSHCLSVLTHSDFQCPLCFTHIPLWAILKGTSYTTPVCFCSGVLFFTCIRSLFMVFIGLKTGFTPTQPFHVANFKPILKPVSNHFNTGRF